MKRWQLRPDSVAVFGCAIGIISIVLNWYTLSPNRIARGVGVTLWNGPAWGIATISVLWLLCLGLSIYSSFPGSSKRNALILGIILNLLTATVFLFTGKEASDLLQNGTRTARVSLGSGFWLSLLGAYISIYACRRKLHSDPLQQNLVSWPAIIIAIALVAGGYLNNISVMVEYTQNKGLFLHEFLVHLLIFSLSAAIGTLIGIPLGIWASRSRIAEKPVFFITNILQTVPSLVLFGLLIAPLSALSIAYPVLRSWGITGIGAAPAIIALILYSLLPVAQNTYTGLKQIDPAVLDSGRGMGMSRFQVFYKIELPLSGPLVLEGVRTASVQAVGNTAVAALIGAGGLGFFIFAGISQTANDLVVLGAIPIVVLAIVVDNILRFFVRTATPRGLKTT